MPTIMDEHGRIVDTGTEFDGLDRFEARDGGRARRCARRAGSSPRSARTSTASGTARAPTTDRAAAVPAVVRQGRPAGQGRRRRGARRSGRRSTRRSWSRATSPGSTTCTTGASPGSCGGATGSRSGTARTARCVCVGPDEEPPGEGWDAGPGRARHLVLLRRCGRSPPSAGRSRPPTLERFYPTVGAGHRLRHPVLLGRPDDDVRAVRDGDRGRRAACRSTPSRCTAWCATSTARRCRSRAGNTVDPLDWMDRLGADAVRFTLARGATPAPTCRSARTGSQASAQLRPPSCGTPPGSRWSTARRRRPTCRRAEQLTDADRWILDRLDEVVAAGRRAARATTSSPRPPRRSTTSPGTRSATGTWSWPRCSSPTGGDAAEGTRRVLGGCSTCCCGCCTRCAVRHRDAVDDADRRGVAGDRRLADAVRAQRRTPAAADGSARLQRLVTEVRRFRADQGLPPGAAGPGPAVRSGRRGRRRRGRHPRRCPAGRRRGRLPADRHPEVALPGGTVTVELDTSAHDRRGRRARPARPRTSPPPRRSWRGHEAKLGNQNSWTGAPAEVVEGSGRGGNARRDADDQPGSRAADDRRSTPRGMQPVRRRRDDGLRSRLRRGEDDLAATMLPPRRPRTTCRTPRAVCRRSAAIEAGARPALAGDAGSRRRLERITALLDLLGNPQRAYPVIHDRRHQRQDLDRAHDRRAAHRVGLRTGRYTSPHLQLGHRADRARRRADHRASATSRSTGTSRRTSTWSTRLGATAVPLSKFEILTAMAFAAFADAPVDAGGGRGRAGRALGRHERRRRRRSR